MRIYKANIAQGIGDNIMAKCYADQVKDRYDQIYFTHHAPIVQREKNNSPQYWNFLHEVGQLFFTEPPYVYNQGEHPFRDGEGLISDFNIVPQKPQVSQYKHLLCKGTSLNLPEEYIVLTTKIRYVERSFFNQIEPQLWQTIKELSNKYKIVILGERQVEICQDYLYHGINQIYGIYPEIIKNVPANRVLDLTIPALGITSPTLSQIQQDCLIMSEAKLVITLGLGGNFCMAIATSNVVGYRRDNIKCANDIYDQKYSDAMVSKDWNEFITAIKSYL
jgi:hypothetical protein